MNGETAESKGHTIPLAWLRQVNMDYSFANALKYNMGNISQVINFYDINCSYMKKLQLRLEHNVFIVIQGG